MRILFTILTSMMITAMSFGQGFVISQYIETDAGTTPKGIEIFNNTGSTVNFATTPLTVYQGTNGGGLAILTGATVSAGTLANQAVMVVGTSDIGAYLTSNGLGSVLFKDFTFGFNGDDALEIRLGGIRQDTFGTPGTDPGSSWPAPSGGSPSTANQNIAIKCAAITAGAASTGWTNPNVRFDFVASGSILTGFGVAPSCGSGIVRLLSVDPDAKNITMKNFGTASIDISAYRLCSNFQYTANLSSLTLVSGSLNLAPNASVTVSWNPAGGFASAGADMGVYLAAGAFTDPAAMVDWMQWKTANNGRHAVAVAKGIWASGNNFVAGTAPYFFTGGATDTGVSFWQETPPVCTATLSYVSATCDATTAGTDTYTSTFSFDIGSHPGPFNVTATNGGTPSTTVISTTGNITVSGVNEGVTTTLTVTNNSSCTLQATSVAPTCVPPPSVSFVSATTSASEGGSTVDLCVAITSPSSTSATSVDVVFDDVFSGATSPGDFTVSPAFSAGTFGPTVTLNWPATDATNKCITLTIVDDALVEGDELADFFMDNPSAPATIGAISFNQLTISDNDGPQPCPTAPVWEVVTTDNNPSAIDGNNGEWTPVGPTGYTANGFCGGGCQDLTDTWLIYGPLDASTATALSMTLDATESFGTTDLSIKYSTDYGSTPCPTTATWSTAGTIATGGTGLSFDMTAAAGSAGIFIGIQYNDDGVDGYSDWTLDNFVLISDACPAVGTPPTSSCVICTTTLVASGSTCDAETAGTDTYTATFTYDATTELNDLAVTVTGGTSATTTVTAGTSGTITVSGTEGTDVTVDLNNALCTLSATENSPVCVPVPASSCGAGETSLVFDSYEGGSSASVVNPVPYDSNNDTWIHRSSMGSIAGANAGVDFWAMQDLDNTVGGGAFDHELTYNMTFTAGDYSSLNVSFYYYTSGFNSTDHLGYKFSVDGGTQTVVGQGQLESLSQNTAAWTQVTLSIPVDGAATSAQFVLYGFQNGGGQYGGFDDLNICGSSTVACTAALLLNSVECDANTAGTDTYTATFDYDASLETEDLIITVVPAPTSQSATTITAGTGPGQFTVTMPETTASYTVTLSNTACSIEETVIGVACNPLPQVTISEIMYNTSGTDDEWIEICNTGLVAQPLVGFEILVNSTLEYTFLAGTPDLAVGQCITIALGDNFTAPFNPGCGFTPDYTNGSSTNTLSNSAATITLTDGTNTVDEVSYDDADGADGNDASLHVIDINADNSSTGSNWQEVAGGGSPGVNSLFSLCASNEDCADAISITPSVFGVPAWEVFQLGGSESLPGCAGDAGDDAWFKFVANSANDVIIAQDPAAGYDVVVELFSSCGGTSLGCFNNYGAGSIERALAGNLTEGAEYYFRVYDAATGASASTSVQVMVKTFEDGQLYGASCGATGMSLPQVIYAERDEMGQLYTNPVVGVVGYGFRFQEQGGPLDVVVQQPVTDGFYLQLSNVPGLQYGKTYDVTVQHRVIIPANGFLDAYWSDFGTTCTVSLGAAPTAQLKPQYCVAATDYYLADQIQSVYVAGANRYRFTFSGSSTFVKESTNYGVFLYSVGSAGNGLQYGNSYSVTVEARINGVWTLPGAACTIFMQGQPEDTNLKPEFCGGTYMLSNSNYLLAKQVLGASKYEFKFSPTLGGTALTQVNNSLSFAFHLTSLPFVAGTSYSVQVRALAGGVWGDYASSCDITVVAPPSIGTGNGNNTVAEKAISSESYFSLYPNPNDGTEFMITKTEGSFSEGTIGIEILDITGKLIHSERKAVKGDTRLLVNPMSDLRTGVYLLRVTDELGSKVIRFTVN